MTQTAALKAAEAAMKGNRCSSIDTGSVFLEMPPESAGFKPQRQFMSRWGMRPLCGSAPIGTFVTYA
jgi:hypothetical protein